MLRRSPRTLALWAGAVLLAVVTAVVAAGDLATLHRRTTELGPERPALVARRTLAYGATVTADDVAVRRIHAGQLPPRAATDRRAVVGHVVRFPVARGSFVTAAHVAPVGRHRSDVLPAGTRAVRVPVAARPELDPGDVVDVYAGAGPDVLGTGRPVTGTDPVATGAVVLAVDPTRAAADGTDRGVTLLVDAGDVDAVAATRSGVVLTLVPPADADAAVDVTSR